MPIPSHGASGGNLTRVVLFFGSVPNYASLNMVGNSTLGISGTTTSSFVLPTTSNTGPRVGLTNYSGDYTLNTDGASVSGLHITGSLYLAANNVSATDCQIDGGITPNGASGGNYFYPVKTNQTVSYCTTPAVYATGCNGLTFDHCRFTGPNSATTMQLSNYDDAKGHYVASNVTIKNSYFDNPQSSTTATHLEAIHLMGVTTALIQNNNINYTAPDSGTKTYITAGVNIQNYATSGYSMVYCDSITLDSNQITGGGYYQFYLAATNSVVKNNSFIGGYGPSSVQYPPSSYPTAQLPGGTYPYFTQSNNTADGTAITLPGGT